MSEDVDEGVNSVERKEFLEKRNKFHSAFMVAGCDPQLEKHGVWMDFETPEGKPIVSVKAKRPGGKNIPYLAMWRDEFPNGRKSLDVDEIHKKMAKIYAKTILTDWGHVSDEKGNPVPFSQADCEEFLNFFPDIFSQIIIRSNELTTFQEERLKDSEKN